MFNVEASIKPQSEVSDDPVSAAVDRGRGRSIYSRLFSLKGRASRGMYFVESVLGFVALMAFVFGFGAVMEVAPFSEPVAMLAVALAFGVYAWNSVVMTVRRLHDLDRSGWHFFLFLLPIYNIVLSLTLLFGRGYNGSNQYGEDPRPCD